MSTTKTWFLKTRGSYLPCSWQGWLTYLPYLAYIVGVAIFALHTSHDFWQAIFIMVPNWVAAWVIMTWIAQQTSKK